MHTRLSKTKKAVVGASVVLGSMGIGGASFALVNGGGAGAATSSPQTSTTHNPPKGRMIGRFLLRHTVDATLILHTKNGYQTLSAARGTVTVNGSQITVTPPEGSPLTATITSTTKFHNTSQQQLTTGDKVAVVALGGNALVVAGPHQTAPTSG